MPKKLALLTLHGMGDTSPTYYVELHDLLKKALGNSTWNRIAFRPIYYQNVLQGNQAEIFGRMRDQIDWMKLRRFLLYGFSDAASLEYRKDVAGSPYFETQKIILQTLDSVFEEAGRNAVPVIVVAQSLGCQVISSYIWDAQQQQPSAGIWHAPPGDGVAAGSTQDQFRRMQTLQRLYTTGCNIPIFVAGHKNIQAIQRPNQDFKWHNLFDEDDVLGWPLRPLSPSYEALVEDLPVNAGGGLLGAIATSWNPFSHEQYWRDSEVIEHLARTIRALA